MSRRNSQQTFEIEDLLEIVIEIINNQPVPAVNPPTPSVNDFPQAANDFLFTDQEIAQLKKAINNLETAEKETVTSNRKEFVERLDNHQFQEELKPAIKEELKQELKQEIKEELKQELKQEITSQLKEELKPKSKVAKKSDLIMTEGQENTFKKELIDYSLEYTPVKVTIHSGKEIKGVLCEVETDFIIVANQETQFIKLPLAKIIAVKKIDDLKSDTEKKPTKQAVKAEETEKEEEPMPLPAPEKLLDRELVKVESSNQ